MLAFTENHASAAAHPTAEIPLAHVPAAVSFEARAKRLFFDSPVISFNQTKFCDELTRGLLLAARCAISTIFSDDHLQKKMRSQGITRDAALYFVAADAVGGNSRLPDLTDAKKAGAKLNALASKIQKQQAAIEAMLLNCTLSEESAAMRAKLRAAEDQLVEFSLLSSCPSPNITQECDAWSMLPSTPSPLRRVGSIVPGCCMSGNLQDSMEVSSLVSALRQELATSERTAKEQLATATQETERMRGTQEALLASNKRYNPSPCYHPTPPCL